jgi:2'-5' RNA ligase superfamily protein
VTSSFPPFSIRLNRLTRSFDQWLFLALSDGNAEMIDLHDRLYTGLLAPFLRSDIEYIPHVGLGHFGRPDAAYDPMEPQEVPLDRPRYARALQEAQRLGLDYRCEVASIGVVSLDTQLRGITRDEVGLGQAD